MLNALSLMAEENVGGLPYENIGVTYERAENEEVMSNNEKEKLAYSAGVAAKNSNGRYLMSFFDPLANSNAFKKGLSGLPLREVIDREFDDSIISVIRRGPDI